MKKLGSTIKTAAPDAVEKISYGMPTFTMNGRYLIYFAGWKNHISIYPVPAGDIEFNKKIEPYIAGKGTLKLPLDEPLPLELVTGMVRLQIVEHQKQITAQANLKGEK